MIRNPRAITAASFAAMFFLGVGSSLIGAAARSIGLSPEQIGVMLAVQNVGFAIAVAWTGALSDTHPKGRLLLYGSLVLGLSFLAYYAAPSFLINLVVMAFIGAGIGSYEGVADALLFDLHATRAGFFINVNHLFVTLGAWLIALYLMFLSLQWRAAVIQSGIAVLLLAVLFWFIRVPVDPERKAASRDRFRVLARSPLVIVLFICAALAVGGEATVIGILTTFMAETRGVPALTAQIGLLVFLAGIALGRLLIGYLAKPARIRGLMTALFGLSAIMLSLLFLVDFGSLLLPVTFLAGLTVSALLPLILAYAGLAFPDMAGTVMGAVKIAIPVGGIITPLLMSAVTTVSSFAVALLVVPVGLLCGMLILLLSQSRPDALPEVVQTGKPLARVEPNE